MDKRLVLLHTSAPFAGLRQILGRVDETMTLPSKLVGLHVNDDTIICDLLLVHDRYVCYRECTQESV